jgi:hypothetical protein
VSFGDDSALKADILDGLDGLVVEPDGIEPTTSSMPLSWTYVSHDCHLILALSISLVNSQIPCKQPVSSLVNSQFQRILVFRSFPVVDFRWRFGGDLSGESAPR